MKDNLRILLAFLISTTAFYACSPKYTASFNPSGTFYTPQVIANDHVKETSQPVVGKKEDTSAFSHPVSEAPDVLIASQKQEQVPLPKKTGSVEEVIAKYQGEKKLPGKKDIAQLSAKEKRALVKEVKRDIKTLKKAKKKGAVQNKKVYAGIIIALAGLVIAILVSGTIGGLGILVGVVLIAWGLIESGTL